LLNRKGRSAASAFLVEGPHAVADALGAPGHLVREVFITEPAADREVALLRAAASASVTVRVVSDRVLATMRDTVTPQGVIAVVDLPAVALVEAFAPSPHLGVILDAVADPGNAGAVIRTADAAGAAVVVAAVGSVDVWSGKCVRSSAGSVFHLPVVTGVPVVSAIEAARGAGSQVLATAGDGDADLDDLIDSGALMAPTVWVFGNEAHGLSSAARAGADRIVRLPIYGRAESLNLAAAAAICLYASARARRV
jgi:TrmH family RNA methyltransferase